MNNIESVSNALSGLNDYAVGLVELEPKDLRTVRKYLGLTQQELAGHVGVSAATVCQGELGRPVGALPRIVEVLIDLANAHIEEARQGAKPKKAKPEAKGNRFCVRMNDGTTFTGEMIVGQTWSTMTREDGAKVMLAMASVAWMCPV